MAQRLAICDDPRDPAASSPFNFRGIVMPQVIYAIVLVLLVAFVVDAVRRGTWYGTWCASGKRANGPQFPGGPHRDPGRF
jgi:hypothetical protein